jgi:hypothetical protein
MLWASGMDHGWGRETYIYLPLPLFEIRVKLKMNG